MEDLKLKLFFNFLAAVSLFHLLNECQAFRIDLVHRDSPHSPLYDPSQTHTDRLKNAIRRSVSRIGRFRASAKTPGVIQADVVSNLGEYLMNVSLGTPPVPILAIADTGSDLIWTQCKPCSQCYKQISPFFDPKKSSSYKDLGCKGKACGVLGNSSRCISENKCGYNYWYGDSSFTNGNLAVETLTILSTNGKTVKFSNIVFGCGHKNGGTFDKKGSGLIGLGGGALSMISQLSSSINGVFSYCLLPIIDSTTSSKMNFGKLGVVSGSGTVSTPLIQKKLESTFYYLTLEAITVGKERLPYEGISMESSEQKGNIMIDSGTTLTLLPQAFHSKVETRVAAAIRGERVKDPEGLLSLCYRTNGEINSPTITFHFTGADLELKAMNTFVRVEDDLVCFSMVPSSDFAIFGNLAQMNFLVGYDLRKKKVSFKPADCSRY